MEKKEKLLRRNRYKSKNKIIPGNLLLPFFLENKNKITEKTKMQEKTLY